MYERTVREIVTVGVVVMHILSGVSAVFLFLRFGLDDELKSVLAILAPILMVSVTAVVSYYLKHMHQLPHGSKVTWVVLFLFGSFLLGYAVMLFGSLIMRVYSIIDYSTLAQILGVSESLFGAFMTRIVLNLFQEGEPREVQQHHTAGDPV